MSRTSYRSAPRAASRYAKHPKRLAAALVLSLATVLAATGCSATGSASGSAASNDDIVVADGGGTYGESLARTTYGPVSDETGLNITQVSYDHSIGSITAQVQGAKQWDVIAFSGYLTDEEAAKILRPIDYTNVSDDVPESARHKYWVDNVYSGITVGYRTDKYDNDVTSWADLIDQDRFPGARALSSTDPRGNLEAALLADGVPADHLYPLDLDRAFSVLDKLASGDGVVFYSSGAEQVQLFQSGQASIGVAWNGRMLGASKSGVPVSFPADQMILLSNGWAVAKTAPNPEGAQRFIDAALSPKVQAADSTDFVGNIPTIPSAFDLIPEDIRASIPSLDDGSSGVVISDTVYWSENTESVTKRWQDWMAAL